MTFAPTDEQLNIQSLFRTGSPLLGHTVADTGKTSALIQLADTFTEQRRIGLYPAFNKALRSDQPVLTPDGWREIGKLRVGDAVVGRDGKSYRVNKVIPRGVRSMYEVEFSDGTCVFADDEHLWLTQTITYDAKRDQWKTRTTKQLADTVHQIHRVPHLTAPVEMPKRHVPIDPYLLGALLGDGSFKNRAVLFCCVEAELVDLVRKSLPEGHSIVSYDNGNSSWAITADRRGRGRNHVLNSLRELGLHGHGSKTKFIPPRYLYGSADQRVAVLQGLMDTDGCANGPTSPFVTTSKRLAADVVYLAQSLGGVATVRTIGNGSYWVNVRLSVEMCPFRLPRKIAAWRPRTRDEQTPRKVVAVRRATEAQVTCISINAADHLFLAAGCIPTHNSHLLLDTAAAVRSVA